MAAEQAVEQVAEVTRKINPGQGKFFLGGLGVGIVVGFYFGHRWNRAKIRAEAFNESQKEVEEIRSMYRETSYRQVEPKPKLEEIIEERGYVPPVERPLPAPVPVQEPQPAKRNLFDEHSKDDDWDYAEEIRHRKRNHPYIIHQDEFKSDEPIGYNQVTWTYYAGDNILSDEHDQLVVRPELTIGEENLKKFGHGSDDMNIVYIRNDRIEMEFEICRSFGSYAVDVQGHDPDDVEDTEPDRE